MDDATRIRLLTYVCPGCGCDAIRGRQCTYCKEKGED